MSEDKDTTPTEFKLSEPPSWGEVVRARNRAAGRRFRARNREAERARSRAIYAADPEKANARAKAALARRLERDPGHLADGHLRRKYRMSVEKRALMIAEQGGGCAVCGVAFDSTFAGGPHVDHDHASGRVRGILCANCNKALGFAFDSPKRLRALAAYLE